MIFQRRGFVAVYSKSFEDAAVLRARVHMHMRHIILKHAFARLRRSGTKNCRSLHGCIVTESRLRTSVLKLPAQDYPYIGISLAGNF